MATDARNASFVDEVGNATYENASSSADVTPGFIVNTSLVAVTGPSATADVNATSLIDTEASIHTAVTSTVTDATVSSLFYGEVDLLMMTFFSSEVHLKLCIYRVQSNER